MKVASALASRHPPLWGSRFTRRLLGFGIRLVAETEGTAPCYWLGSQKSETTAQVAGVAERRSLVRSSRRPSAAVSGPEPLRNVAGSARWRWGRAARPRLLGGGDRGSAPGARRLKSWTNPTCSRTRGVAREAGVGPDGLWVEGAVFQKSARAPILKEPQ